MKMDKEARPTSFLDLLTLVPAGRATITLGGVPLLSVNADEKTLEVEADGIAKAGLHFSDLAKPQEGPASMLGGAMHATGALSRAGWRLTLYDGGERVLTMGKGVSRLTGRVSVSPLRLRKLLKVLRQ